MKHLLSDLELGKVSTHIAEQMGLHFPPSKWQSLEQCLCHAAKGLGFQDIRQCVTWFTSATASKEFIETMACYLTVGETYFLREIRCFDTLEQQILPAIIRKRQGREQRLRIWSAGCATGEEPYSIAILLYRMRETLRNWEISILATDVNPHALRKAREGVYTNWSFRNTPADFKENYFRKTAEGRFELLPEIKEMVKFSGFNLAEDPYPSLLTDTNALDVIFCRNVLMYLTPQLALKVVERFQHCLLDGGWLFVSPCETSNPLFSGFEPIAFPDAILYRKLRGGKRGRGNEEQKEDVSPRRLHDLPTQKVPRFSDPSPLPDLALPEADPYRESLALYERGAYGEAAERVASQLARDKDDTRALALLSRICANEGRLTEALNATDQALAGDKLNTGLHYLRAVILQEQGLDDEAGASLKRALYLDQDLVLAHFTLANLEQRRGKIKESRRHFDNTLTILDRYPPDKVIPESDGMSARRLKEIIRGTTLRMCE